MCLPREQKGQSAQEGLNVAFKTLTAPLPAYPLARHSRALERTLTSALAPAALSQIGSPTKGGH